MDNSILVFLYKDSARADQFMKVEDKSEKKSLTSGQFLNIDKVVGAG